MAETVLPLELGDVAPGPDFTKMEMGRGINGVPEGVHTGGPWLSADGKEVWKPLDAKPYPNATGRYPTNEDVCLEAMAGRPGFPVNWRVEERNGRRWLVRPLCWLWPQERQLRSRLEVVLLIEQAVFDLNAAGWEAFGSDLPQAAIDPAGNWFVLDLSAAFRPPTWRQDWHGDRAQVWRWIEAVGYGDLANLRRRGMNVAYNVSVSDIIPRPNEEPFNANDVFYDLIRGARKAYRYVYASTLRPLGSWCKIDGARFLRGDLDKSPRVHSWVVADHLLDQETLDQYELTFAYRPWP